MMIVINRDVALEDERRVIAGGHLSRSCVTERT